MTKPKPQKPVRVKWLRRIFIGSGWLSLAASVVALLAIFHRPGWFHPQSIDWQRLPEDKREFVKFLDDTGAALNSGKSITLELSEDQVNRWLSARHELPEFTRDIQGNDEIQCRFTPTGITAATLVRRGALRVVVSATLEIAVAPETIKLRAAALRIGGLPVPASMINQRLADALSDGSTSDGWIAGANEFTWPNGKRPYRIASIEPRDKSLRVTLEPAPR